MSYEISFKRRLEVLNADDYINECCWGGDVVRDQLLSGIEAAYADVVTGQEDWGWFIWFKLGKQKFAVDIFCDVPSTGEFRIRLSSRQKSLLFSKAIDSPELESLRELVTAKLEAWAGKVLVRRVAE